MANYLNKYPPVMDIFTAAEALNVSAVNVLRLIAEGKLGYVCVESYLRVTKKSIVEFLSSYTRKDVFDPVAFTHLKL